MIYFYAHSDYQTNKRLISKAFYSIEEMIANVIQNGFIPSYWINDCNVRFYCEDDSITEINRQSMIERM